MALKLNPLTGQMDDDGLPEDPNAVQELPPVTDTVSQTPAGTDPGTGRPALGSAENPMVTTIAPGAKPTSETVTTDRRMVEGPKAQEAATTLQATRVLENVAQDRATDVAAQEARVTAAAADAKAAELEQENRRRREAEAAREQDREKWVQGEKSIVAAEVEARKKQTDPEGDYWKERPVAKVFSNILQVLGEIAAGIATPQDPTRKSRVDTTLEGMIARHRDKLVKEWEATKEARQLQKENRAAWEAEKDKIEVRAANESEAQLRLVEAQLEANIAKLGPQKAAAANDLLKRSTAKADAALDLERADKFNRLTERQDTDREYPAKDAGAGSGVTVGGKTFATRGTPAEQGKVRDKAAATKSLLTQLDEYDALIAEGASPGTTGTRRADIKSRLAALTGAIKESKQLGALDNGVQNLVKGMVGDPTSLTTIFEGGSEGIRKKIANTRSEATKSLGDTLVVHGNDPNAVNDAIGVKPAPGPKVGAADLANRSVAELEAAFKKALNDPDKERAKRRSKAIRAALDAKKQPAQGR